MTGSSRSCGPSCTRCSRSSTPTPRSSRRCAAFGHDRTQRRQQRNWDRRTLDYFTTLASDEFGLDPTVARPAVSILLSGVVSLLTQARADRSPRHRAAIEETFVGLAVGGLRNLASASGRSRPG